MVSEVWQQIVLGIPELALTYSCATTVFGLNSCVLFSLPLTARFISSSPRFYFHDKRVHLFLNSWSIVAKDTSHSCFYGSFSKLLVSIYYLHVGNSDKIPKSFIEFFCHLFCKSLAYILSKIINKEEICKNSKVLDLFGEWMIAFVYQLRKKTLKNCDVAQIWLLNKVTVHGNGQIWQSQKFLVLF